MIFVVCCCFSCDFVARFLVFFFKDRVGDYWTYGRSANF